METQIVFDVETTGLHTHKGDRIIEIGFIEINKDTYLPTGKFLHKYFNPNFEVSQESFEIHGLSNKHLEQFGIFEESAEEIIKFIGNNDLIAHNAGFDMKFLQNELKLSNKDALINNVIDTLQIARKKFPGQGASLNALCKKFNVDLSERGKHGALLDSELLAQVYMHLMGGNQPELLLNNVINEVLSMANDHIKPQYREYPLSEQEELMFKKLIKNISNSLWHHRRTN